MINSDIVNIFYHKTSIEKLKVGRLALKNRDIYFEYDKEFLSSGIELSPYKLPLKTGVFKCDDNIFDGLFGVFADSLPDGWGRLLMDRHLFSYGLNPTTITPLHRLLAIGKYGIGALSYEPLIESFKENQTINLDDLASSSLDILRGISEKNIDTLIANNGSSAGARPKIMVQINDKNEILPSNQALKKGFEHYLVKFSSINEHKDIGKLEYVYYLLAKESGIQISKSRLLKGANNSYFSTKRFDRIGENRVHIHSLAGMVHSDFRIPSIDYDDIMTLTFHLTKDINEVIKVYKLAVFNLLTYNRDDHAKNFSFLLDNNTWKFSPAYDLTFSYGIGGEHNTTYLYEGKNPTKEHLEKLAKKHHIKEYKTIIDDIYGVTRRFKEYAKEFDISKKYIDEVFGQFLRI